MAPPLKTCRVCSRTYSGGETFCPEDGSRLFMSTANAELELDPLVGATLDGRYRVLRLLGEGGMGRVYEGVHLMIERRVAIKVLREDFTRRLDVVERFRREAKSASRIGHPNIVDVLDFGVAPGGASYFVMELLKGEDLADVLARQGSLPPERAVLIAFQCCHALEAAHDKGVIHRDVKPENVFLVEREGAADFVKVVDFGVAKMSELDSIQSDSGRITRSGVIFGTPEYMSPEQAGGQTPDHRADVYALGITLYELLTGRVPFEGASFMSVLTKHANKPLPALRELNPEISVSPELEAVIKRALAKDREGRFQSMREMARAIEAVPEMPPLPFRVSHPSQPRVSGIAGAGTPPPTPTPHAVAGAVPSGAPIDTPARRSTRSFDRRGVIGAAVALGAVALAMVYVTIERSSGHAAVQLTPQVSASAAGPAGAPPAAGAKIADPNEPLAETALDLALVPVRVTTEPVGASVRVVGGEEVCTSTPCSFDVVSGRPVALLARRGRAQAITAVTPSGATELHLVLDVAPAPGAGSHKGAAPAKLVVGELPAAPDDLKVPEMYRKR